MITKTMRIIISASLKAHIFPISVLYFAILNVFIFSCCTRSYSVRKVEHRKWGSTFVVKQKEGGQRIKIFLKDNSLWSMDFMMTKKCPSYFCLLTLLEANIQEGGLRHIFLQLQTKAVLCVQYKAVKKIFKLNVMSAHLTLFVFCAINTVQEEDSIKKKKIWKLLGCT